MSLTLYRLCRIQKFCEQNRNFFSKCNQLNNQFCIDFVKSTAAIISFYQYPQWVQSQLDKAISSGQIAIPPYT